MNSTLIEHALLAALDPEVRGAIAERFEERDLPAGAIVVEAGAPGGDLHLVLGGWVDVLDADDGGLIAQLGRGTLLGELGLLRDAPSVATVRTTTDSLIATLSAADARHIAWRAPAFALALGRVAAERVQRSPDGRFRPVVTAVVELGGWSDVRALAQQRAARSRRDRVVEINRWPERGGVPGRAAHRRGTALLADALDGIDRLIAWTDAEEPGLSRAVRSADRVVVLGPPAGSTPRDELARITALPADPEADIVLLEVDHGALTSGVGAAPVPGVRRIMLTADERVSGAMRELERRGTIATLLADSPIFGSLRASVRRDLERHLSWRQVASGELIYDVGTQPGGLYMVLTGRVAELRAERVDFLPGFVFGDDGLGEPDASASTRAVRETSLAFVERSALRRLYGRHDALRVALAEQASADIARVRTAAIADRAAIMVVLPDHDPVWRGRLERLRTVLGGAGCALVDRQAAERTIGAGAIEAAAGSRSIAALRQWLASVEERHRYLLCVAHADDPDWLRICLGQTEHRLLLVDGRGDPATLSDIARASRRHIALWWPADGRPQGTARWLDRDPALIWHHVRQGRFDDIGRLVRRLLGRAIGVVLGGASSRCVAHIGLIEAIAEGGLPVDTLSGTSSGSLVAGLVAMQLEPAEVLRRAVDGTTGYGLVPGNIGPPLVSLFSGRQARRIIRRSFGDQTLEDLIVPVKATAVDLRSRATLVLDRGPLWRAVRASSSVPGMWPPVAVDGRLLVDGGLTDNFPHGTIEAECAAGLTIISNLDAGYPAPFVGVPDYGDVLSGWRVLVDTLLRRRTRYPRLSGTVVECLVLGGRRSDEELEARVDPRRVLVVRPPIPKIDLFGLREGPMVAELVETTRRATRQRLGAWQARYGDRVAYSTFVAVPDAGE